MGVQVNFSSVSHSGYWSGSTEYAQSKGAYPGLAVSLSQTANTQISPVNQGYAPPKPDTENIQNQNTALSPDTNGETAKAGEESSRKDNTEAAQNPFPGESREFAELSQAEKQLVNELKQTDTEVHSHEMSHLAAAGSLAISGPSYDYQKGPDGKKYAVAGEVHIDTAPVPGDPEATLQKMQQVKRAALAPADPSSQDRRVAAKATAAAAKARAELMSLQTENGLPSRSSGPSSRDMARIADAYMKMYDSSSEPSRSFSLTA